MNQVSSFEGSSQNKSLEQHQRNELYLETADIIRQAMGEAAAASYLQNNEHYSFGPTGEAVNPLPEMRDMPITHEHSKAPFAPQNEQRPTQLSMQDSNVIDMASRQTRKARQPAGYPAFLQGPETGPFTTQQSRLPSFLGGLAARLSKGERRVS